MREDYDDELGIALPESIGVDMNEVFSDMYEKDTQRISIPRSESFSRKQVVNAFQAAFELIGGVPRLATWAHTNPKEFYRLYSKLLPNQQVVDFGDSSALRIIHSLAPGPLDGPALIEGEIVDA